MEDDLFSGGNTPAHAATPASQSQGAGATPASQPSGSMRGAPIGSSR
jgi:hypothetical protein